MTPFHSAHSARRLLPLAAALFVTGMLPPRAVAQDPPRRIRITERPLVAGLAGLRADRAMIGVSIGTGALADTLGIEVLEVTADGPAAKAGIARGSRLQAINGVSLRISADDARDPATADAGYRRLQRVLDDVQPGDTVSLRVLDGGAARTVRVATVAPTALTAGGAGAITLWRGRDADRASLGVLLGGIASPRDTLGVFVSGVIPDGPAARAGLVEGERIAAINGVDVRVPREDVTDRTAHSARVQRFTRTLEDVKPGAPVSLRVFGGGRYRDVTLEAAAAGELDRFGLDRLGLDRLRLDRLDVERPFEAFELLPGRVLRDGGPAVFRFERGLERPPAPPRATEPPAPVRARRAVRAATIAPSPAPAPAAAPAPAPAPLPPDRP